jgi:CBS domain-containing protein
LENVDNNCSEVMTRDPVCCVPADGVAMAARFMEEFDVGSIPVVESGLTMKLIGIVTDRDLALKVVAEKRDTATTKVEDVMTRGLATCRPEDDLQKALDLMAEQQLRRVPVVNDGGRIVGIIAQADVATRTSAPEKTGIVVEEISKPHAGAEKSSLPRTATA